MHYLLIYLIILILVFLLIWWIVASAVNSQNDTNTNGGPVTALLELTGDGWTQHDNAVAIELSLTHPDVTVINTESSQERTLELLKSEYARGIRRFIGGSRSTMLESLRAYILSKPDLIFTSVGSTAVPLAAVDNIYRLAGPDSNLPVILPGFFNRDAIHSANGDYAIVSREGLGQTEFIYFLTQLDDEWTTSTTEVLIPAFNNVGIQTAVSYIDINLSEQEIAAQLESEIPDLPERSVFMAFIAGNDNQKFYSSLQYAPRAKTHNHYAGDATAFFTFEGAAVQQALDVNLRAYSYTPADTPKSVEVTEQTGEKLQEFVHPFSVMSVDAVGVMKETANNADMLANLDAYFGITGSLASDENGDRITGQYIWFYYRRSQEPDPEANTVWSPDFILGKSLLYGDFAGPFVILGENGGNGQNC